jgi:hypothetical protein
VSWKDRLPWLLLAALWLESALFHSYLSSAIPLFPVFVTLPQGWSVWIPPLVVALLYITLGRMFAKKSWLPWTLTTLSSVYILADIVIFSTHLGQHAESLWFRFSGAVTVLLLFIFAVTQKNVRPGSWVSVIAAIGMISAFWGSPWWAYVMALMLAGKIWRWRRLPAETQKSEKPR